MLPSARQVDMFGVGQPLNGAILDPDVLRYRDMYKCMARKVRSRLTAILAELRAGQAPWPTDITTDRGTNLSLYKVIFPQMTNWLPRVEAERLRAEFAAEFLRLTGEPPPPPPAWKDAYSSISEPERCPRLVIWRSPYGPPQEALGVFEHFEARAFFERKGARFDLVMTDLAERGASDSIAGYHVEYEE